jgi:Phosphotransferase enzyme family
MGTDIQGVINTFIGGSNCNPDAPAVAGSQPTVTLCRTTSRTAVIQQLKSQGFTRVLTFGIVPSASNARWLIPVDQKVWTLAGLRVFQPFAITAKLLKPLLVAGTRLGWTGWASDHAVVASRNPLEIESLVTGVTGERQPVFALSLGTPGKFRKLSLRVMRPNGELLGYIKLPLTEAAIGRVRREAAMLTQLFQNHLLRPHIPRVLYAGEWGAGFILFQSARESESAPAPVRFGDLHRTFLDRLAAVASVEISGSDFVDRVAKGWDAAESRLSASWRAAGSRTLDIALRELQHIKLQCGVSHGDFTPWNTLVSARRLFVFDWESAESQVPHVWDRFHFRTQTSIFLKRTRRPQVHLDRESGERASFLLYLLDSARGYLEEGSSAANIALEYRYQLLTNQLLLN